MRRRYWVGGSVIGVGFLIVAALRLLFGNGVLL